MIEHKNNTGDTYYVLKEYSKRVFPKSKPQGISKKFCLVRFKETGYEREVYRENHIDGKVKDPYTISTHGHGYLGVFEKTEHWKLIKVLWRNMIKRCYNPKDKHGYYGKCFVDDRWKGFENFLLDIPKLKGYNLWLKGQLGGDIKYQLDKDFIVNGNNIYSRETCMFVEESINKADGAKRGKPYTKKKRF